jgi:hypothetical protein
MTYSVIRVSAIVLGGACLVSLSPLSPARANMSAASGTTSATSGATSAPNPAGAASTSGGAASTGNAAASAGSERPAVQPPSRPYVRHYAHHYTRHTHYAWRNGHRYVYYGYRHNPVAAGAATVAGGIADLGSIAAYPIYCFPNYGSCPVYLPY